jgi:hypothetical protein
MTQLTQLRRLRLAARVIAVYWLLVLAGLAVLTLDRLGDARADLPSLWVGAIAGTVLGQVLAVRNFRPWLASLLIGLAAYFLVPLVAAGFGPSLWKVFIPAALCGLWSLGDRTALIALWFPIMVWMLSILDRTTGALSMDASGAGLFGALAIGGVLFLRARERRRVELWRKVSVMPLGKASAPSVLKARPGHGVARAGWTLAITAIAAAVTAWIAPRLWQVEPIAGDDEIAVAELAGGAESVAAGDDLPCCPVSLSRAVPRSRIREYLDIGRGHDGAPGPFEDARATACHACEGEIVAATPEVVDTVELAPVAAPVPMPVPVPVAVSPEPVVVVEPTDRPAQVARPTPAPAPTIAPMTPPTPTPLIQQPPPVPHVAAPHHARPAPPRHGITWWPWLVVLISGALIFQLAALGLRPLRRLLILRHLRRPFWNETVDQRVSNAWQLALIGLCDAGWRPNAAEAPRELAARVGVDGVEACAVILERARHGLGIDADDLAEIQRQADLAYASARAHVTRLPRALGWLRWPLT